MNSFDPTAHDSEPLYEERAAVAEVIPCQKKDPVYDNADISLYGTRIVIASGDDRLCFEFGETSAITVLGKNKLNVYHGDKIYQIKGSERFNALKYVHMYNRYKNVVKGEENVKFLGL